MRNYNNSKKYRVEISSDGNFADVYLLTGALKSCFHIDIQQGKAILKDDIQHTMSIIPTSCEAVSSSPFTYDEDIDALNVILTLKNKDEIIFTTSICDLMNKDISNFDCNHQCSCNHENKPMIERFVTKTELKEEAIRRKKEDDKIYEILGTANCTTDSIFDKISSVQNKLDYETERSKQQDLEHAQSIKQINCESQHLKDSIKTLNSRVSDVAKINDEKCNELYSTCDEIKNDICSLQTDLRETNNTLRKEVRRATEEERNLKHTIIQEETLRHNEDDKIRCILKSEVAILNDKIDKLDDKYQEKGDYVSFTNISKDRKGIVLDNYNNILGKGTDGSSYNIAMVSKWDVVDFGSSSLPINLNGSNDRPTYNDSKKLALVDDVVNLTEFIKQKFNSLNTVIDKIDTQFNTIESRLKDLEIQVSILNNTIEDLQTDNQTIKDEIISMKENLHL